ncbi:MAG: quaternary ammonium compound efflux SMR transporter SugE [Parachlamydiaceae bacterium]|nr:quaternary ammonium compound efflux SMR transporter SugE [Parachlamydiaceae bacterium]
MDWMLLIIAGLMEVVWAVGLKYTEGFTKLYPSSITLAAMAISFACLSTSLRTIPMGTAYAVWVGIGAVGVALIGMFYLGEPKDVIRIACLSMIVIGIIGLKTLV